jgi:hypothetical protein
VRVTVIAAGLDAERTSRGVGRDGELGAASTDTGGSSFNSSSPVIPGPAAAPAPAPAAAPAPVPPSAPAPRPFSPAPASPAGPAVPAREPGGTADAGHTDPGGDGPFEAAYGSNGTSLAVSAVLGAPVPDDGVELPSGPPAETSPVTISEVAAAPDADSPSYRSAKTFDVAATRRRPVVFEEDDDLDVPDFLK